MAKVQCKYCKQQFDREKIKFVQIPVGKVFRYAHPDCYKAAVANGIETAECEILDPADNVMCAFCNKALRRTSADCVEVSPGRYMHVACAEQDKAKEKDPKEKLFDFLMEMCRWEFVPPGIQKQIQKMIDTNGFTYSGIHGSLKYWYFVKGNNVDRENPIGIVPYIYDKAKQFYKQKAMLRESNNKAIQEQTNRINYIKIKKPIRQSTQNDNFSFLDEGGNK